jgi:predicted metal-dependent hydrolase
MSIISDMEKKKRRTKPLRKVDANKVQMLASFGCQLTEIARFFSADESTIRKKFHTEIKVGREQMKIRLRQLQWKHAEQGNTALLIFLGKQYLGQSDKNELELAGNLEAVLRECGFEDSPIQKTFEEVTKNENNKS